MRASTIIFGSSLLTFSALCASGCGAPPAREVEPIDCTATDIFDDTYPIADEWYPANDGTGLLSCDSLARLLPGDMPKREVSHLIDQLMIQRPQCEARIRCSDTGAILPAPLPQEPLDRVLCKPPAPASGVAPAPVSCDSLDLLLPEDMTYEQVAALVDPLIVTPAGPLCEPRVLCSDHYAILPAPVETDPVDRQFCKSTYARRAVATIDPIEMDDRCGSTNGLHLTAARNNDWGNLWGNYGIAKTPVDASAYEGLAFWAKAAPGTNKSITIVLDDPHTRNLVDDAGNLLGEPTCVDEEGSSDQGTVNQVTGQTGASTSVSTPGYVPSENACGNSYHTVLTVTDDWHLYRLPFTSFAQDATPNRRLQGIERSSIRGMVFRAPKQAVVDMWIDDVQFYHELE